MKKIILLFSLLFFACNISSADGVQMHRLPDEAYTYDMVNVEYNFMNNGDLVQFAKVKSFVENGEVHINKNPRNFSAVNRWGMTREGLYKKNAYTRELRSVYRRLGKDYAEYSVNWLGYPKDIIAIYRQTGVQQPDKILRPYMYNPLKFDKNGKMISYDIPENNWRFDKLDKDGNLISYYKKNEYEYISEYNPDGSLLTKHNTKYLPWLDEESYPKDERQ